MPRSKHRRKPGGKSVNHPGMAQATKTRQEQANAAAWRAALIQSAFHKEGLKLFAAEDPQWTLYMAELIEMRTQEATYHAEPASVRKDKLFVQFVEPMEPIPATFITEAYPGDGEEGGDPLKTLEDAEVALALLVKHELVMVDGDVITIHPRFSDA
jgi:hypothetical protein